MITEPQVHVYKHYPTKCIQVGTPLFAPVDTREILRMYPGWELASVSFVMPELSHVYLRIKEDE